jgi:hypothetical protein
MREFTADRAREWATAPPDEDFLSEVLAEIEYAAKEEKRRELTKDLWSDWVRISLAEEVLEDLRRLGFKCSVEDGEKMQFMESEKVLKVEW